MPPVRQPGRHVGIPRLQPCEEVKTFAVRLPVIVLDHIREVAEQRSLTTSALIRRWIEAGIAEDGSDVGDRVVPVRALLELIGRAPRENADR
ncbi:MAG: hypothetical protein ACYDGN_03085 [Acidimicrobiales bacterium]